MTGEINPRERYVVFDVETTGLSPWKGDRIIEIGAVAIEEGLPAAEFSSLISVPVEIPYHVSQINGITDEMLIGQPTPDEVFPAFVEFISDSALIAHNARFDMGFLRRECELLGISLRSRHICTLEISRRLFPHLWNHKLETVYRHITSINVGMMRKQGDMTGVRQNSGSCPPKKARRQTHRALDDARMTAGIWLALNG